MTAIANAMAAATNGMKSKYIIIGVALLFLSCGNKRREAEVIINDSQPAAEQPTSDSLIMHEEKPKPLKSSSASSASSHSRHSAKYDNMRGFGPASEDDMDDNGMSRYMENNDEEGWD